MTRDVPERHPLHRMFRGLTEHTFEAELGIAQIRASSAMWPASSCDSCRATRRVS